MKFLNTIKFKEYYIFFWIVITTLILLVISAVYKENRAKQAKEINNSFENIYLKKIIKEITNNLEPRFTTFKYVSKSGDTYENIIDLLEVNKKEKK